MKPNKKHATKRPANRSAFLSSRGRIGGCGAEVRTSLDSMQGGKEKPQQQVNHNPFATDG